MVVFEPTNKIWVTTPRGEGTIWLVTEYGTETDTLYTVIQSNGEMWQWTHADLRVLPNISFGRKKEDVT